jgi:hypothetical protein
VTIRRFLAAAVLVGVSGVTALTQSSDPLVGDWKLNADKSKGTSFKSGTSKIEAAGAGVKFTVDLMDAEGTKSHWAFSANYDGKDNPVTGSNPFGDTVALTRVDPKTTRITIKQGGKVTATQIIVVSADGKTRTTTTKGTNTKGQAIDSVSVYEKQ